jgi:hypothetical protein
MKEFTYSNYLAKIIFQLDYLPRKIEKSLHNVWWQNPSGYLSENLPFYSSTIQGKPRDFLLLGDEISSPVDFIRYLSSSSQLFEFIMGGIIFFDFDSNIKMQTNYDLGETEEWKEILKELREKNSSFHTFSATDVPVELTIKNNLVIFQELHWEAMPNRLETSRLTAPIHSFLNKDKFIKEVQRCLDWWDLAINEARELKNNRDEALMALSCKERRIRVGYHKEQ